MCGFIFVNFGKVFDMSDEGILVKKNVDIYSLHSDLRKLITLCLSGKQQVACYKNFLSNPTVVSTGVT